MRISNNILETIGNTPMVKLNRITKGIEAKVYAKLEFFNPGASVKDRMALKMVEDAEKSGLLKPGGTIVEAGIHQTDLMRFWAGDIEWVEAHYIHRDDRDIKDGGDNPYAYSVTYGFTCGMIAHLSMSRLRKTFWGDSYNDIIWDRGHLKLEDGGPVAYYYDGPYPPSGPVETETLRHPLNIGQRNNNTLEINRAFIHAVNKKSEQTLLNTFSSSINSRE